MGRYDKLGQELITETPLSLRALIQHKVEPHEEPWFARCRADYLRSFPLSLLELVRLAMLLSLVGPVLSVAYTIAAIGGWTLVMATQISVRRREAVAGYDEVLALRYRAGTIRIRTLWWCPMLLWAILIAPESSLEAIVALGIAMMVIDGISVVSLPRLALTSSISGGAALVFGLFLRGSAAAGMATIVTFITAAFLHWSIYNLYYLFATRRIRTKRLNQSNETIQLLLNQYDDEGSDWLYEIDRDGSIRNPSQRFCIACGMDAAALEGKCLVGLLSEGQYRDEFADTLAQIRPFRSVVAPLVVAGRERWWSINGRPIHGRDGEEIGWRGFIADISAAKHAEAKVAFMAHYDLLTQLPNRTLFNATLERALARLGKHDVVGLLYVDLDHFKAINDTYGHAMGDRVLTEVGQRLDSVVRPRDMVARLGGDEFVILLTDLHTEDGGLPVAERIMEAVGGSIEIDGQIMPIGASIGMAFAPHDASTGENLLRAADLAMYDAKSRGRRGISTFDLEMQAQMKERRMLELDLRAAIARQELELHYQPLLNLQTGATEGYEALLRWSHPTHGMVPPSTFIPIAEETGTIVEIGEWVIRNALTEAARWPDHLTVAVNLSPAQMRDGDLLPVIINALASSGVAPNRLELEITENLLMQESAEVLAILHRLRELGVRIALDDFGTGYSSLNYLRSFPFDKIKIDRCFVSELAEREDCQAIVRSVITLANNLNMTTTAEGVEVSEQLDALRAGGCDQVQGFYYSRALPAAELHFGRITGGNVAAEGGSTEKLRVNGEPV